MIKRASQTRTEGAGVSQMVMNRIRSIHWPSRLGGMLFTFVMMHILVVRPLAGRMADVEQELGSVRSTMQVVAGYGATVEQTDELLSQLQQQEKHLPAASRAVERLTELRDSVCREAAECESAVAALRDVERELREQVTVVVKTAQQPVSSEVDPSLTLATGDKPKQSRQGATEDEDPAEWPYGMVIQPAVIEQEMEESDEPRDRAFAGVALPEVR